jgi:hypothetical protein
LSYSRRVAVWRVQLMPHCMVSTMRRRGQWDGGDDVVGAWGAFGGDGDCNMMLLRWESSGMVVMAGTRFPYWISWLNLLDMASAIWPAPPVNGFYSRQRRKKKEGKGKL